MFLSAARIVSVSGAPPPAADRHEALEETLGSQRPAHLGEELVVEPARQPAHFHPRAGIARHQAALAEVVPTRLVEIFGDDVGAWNRGLTLFHQHRYGAGRIEDQKILAALPDPFFHQLGTQPEFAEREPDEA